jgi:hypothetical protein
MPDRSTVTADIQAGRPVRILSAGSGEAAARDKNLDAKKIVDHDEGDPRERQLPNGQVPETDLCSSPGRLIDPCLIPRLSFLPD